jgi:hypothetical protein
MGIETILGMIPKGGKYAKSVVNFVHKAPENWEKFTSAIKQITDLLKIGRLRLDGKQKTIFETNKNILKNHEKVVKVELKDANKFFENLLPSVTKKYPPFNVSKTEPFKGWTPTLVERSRARNIYKELETPKTKYTKEMEAIDEELDALAFGGTKYEHLSVAEKNKIMKTLQAEMKKLIAKGEDLTTLSLSQLNKKSHDLQKRIREIKDNPNIKGTVTEGPKADMIDALYKSENPGLTKARHTINRKNSELKYGKKYPVLDPENDAFIITGLNEFGHPNKVSRFIGKFSASKDWKTGDLTRKEGTSYYDTWDLKKNQIRKEGEEVWRNTIDSEGKVIMSNPEYKLSETKNMEIWNNINNEVNISDLSKKGHKLKDIDMLMKGKEVKKYLNAQEAAESKLSMDQKLHERTSMTEVSDIMEDLYLRGDDIYKMSMEEWITKIPEHFAGGGYVSGFATGGISNLFQERQGYRDPGLVIKLAKGARWLIRMLKEMSDDMIYGRAQFAKMAEALKMKYFKQTQDAIKSLESGGPIPDEILTSLRNDARFQGLTVSKTGGKDFIEIQEVVLGKLPKGKGEIIEGKAVEEIGTGEKLLKGMVVDETVNLMEFKKTLPKDLLDKVNQLPVEKQTNLLTVMKRAFDAAKKGGVEGGINVLEKSLLEDFIPKGKPHATGGLISGYATGGVSNLFRQRYRGGKAVELVAKLPEFLKFVERLLIKASNEIRQGVGKWKGLTTSQKVAQHDNLTKLATEFQKTKKFDKSFNEYFGIDAEKAFVEAQSKVKPVKKTRTMDDLVEDAYQEVFYQKPSSGDYKYDADVLATEIAYQGGKIYDDLAAVEKAGIYDLAYKRVIKDLKFNMDRNKILKDVEQKMKLSDFDVTGKKGNAEGGLIGYATGGVSNLFRRR